MGSRRKWKLYNLVFTDGDYEGLEITLRSITLGEMQKLRPQVSGEGGEEEDTLMRMARIIGDHMVSWNREDEDGQPLPASIESLMDEEAALINIIMDKWTEAVAGVPAPLEQPSDAGQSPLTVSIPMEPLQQSLVS